MVMGAVKDRHQSYIVMDLKIWKVWVLCIHVYHPVLGDWNACGKVIGSNKKRIDAKDWFFGKENLGLGDDFYYSDTYMSGNPYSLYQRTLVSE
jgi:hypothetical protein